MFFRRRLLSIGVSPATRDFPGKIYDLLFGLPFKYIKVLILFCGKTRSLCNWRPDSSFHSIPCVLEGRVRNISRPRGEGSGQAEGPSIKSVSFWTWRRITNCVQSVGARDDGGDARTEAGFQKGGKKGGRTKRYKSGGGAFFLGKKFLRC